MMYFSEKQTFCLNIQYSDRQWIPGEPLTMPAAFQNARTVDCQLPNDGLQSDVMDMVDDKPIARWQIKVLSEISNIHLQIFLLRKIHHVYIILYLMVLKGEVSLLNLGSQSCT